MDSTDTEYPGYIPSYEERTENNSSWIIVHC
jgi:hypothetical protein